MVLIFPHIRDFLEIPEHPPTEPSTEVFRLGIGKYFISLVSEFLKPMTIRLSFLSPGKLLVWVDHA